jgi:DNA polymerase I-like protein with 3'-5' exonuclease and polymerase domains
MPQFRVLFQELLDQPNVEWRMHNMSYDIQVLRFNGFTEPKTVVDTMCYMLGLTERMEQTSLKWASRAYGNASYYERELVNAGYSWRIGPRNKADWFALAKYGCLDAYHTYNLGDVLPPLVREEGTEELVKNLLHPAAGAFADWEQEGACVDLSYAAELEAQWLPIIEAAVTRMQQYAREQGFPRDPKEVGQQKKAILCPTCTDGNEQFTHRIEGLPRTQWRTEYTNYWGTDSSCAKCMKRRFVLVPDDNLNVRSYPQLQHLAFDILRMQHPDGKRSTEEVFLAANEEHPFTKHLRDIRELDHLLRNYVRGTSDDVWSDGRVHPDFLLGGTVTGRLAIHNPPLQTLPKWGVDPTNAKLIRKLYVPDDDGCVIAEADYKNLELYIAWHYSSDENLGLALTEQDFHTTTAAAIFRKPYDEVTGADRFNSKFVTFGIAYGRQAWSLAEGELFDLTGGDPNEAQKYIDRFWGLYPRYKQVYDYWQRTAIRTGELRTPMGRVRRWKLITRDKLNHIRNQAVNFPIQSLASDTCLDAGIRLTKLLRERNYGRVLFTVHDSLAFNLKRETKDDALRLIRREMTTPPYQTHIKLRVDIEVGSSLGDVSPWKDSLDFAA